ncbi:MAG: glycosyltransferase [Bacteroidetes bacterium]|nr:MAG: glycosyltransferase [Bacteroidota bacterium]
MRISIITINLNDNRGLEKTMHSVNQQDYPDLEHLIIDGVSTDGSLQTIENLKTDRTHWISEPDQGIYDAQNKGIKMATGDYLLFLNAGDYLVSSNTLTQVVSQLGSHDLVYGDMQSTDATGQTKHLKMHPKLDAKVLYKDTIWHPVSFFRKSLFEQFGNYDTNYRIVADYEFYCRLYFRHHISSKHIPIEVSCFDMSGVSSQEEHREQLIRERKQVQDNYFPKFQLFLFRLYTKLRN